MNDTKQYRYAPLSDTWYRVTEWIEIGGAKLQAGTEIVPKTEVPENRRNDLLERSKNPRSDRGQADE